jgi:transcription factor C subunit 7
LNLPIHLDEGIAEWYGLLHAQQSPDHPTPLDVDEWSKFFPTVKFRKGETGIVPNRRGETMKEIHDRAQRALKALIRRADDDGLDTILLCTHAATNIALGRALTRDPEVCTGFNSAYG